MALSHSTVTDLFTDIASTIRSKTGSNSPIVADAFPTAINAINVMTDIDRASLGIFKGQYSHIDLSNTMSLPITGGTCSVTQEWCDSLSRITPGQFLGVQFGSGGTTWTFTNVKQINAYAFSRMVVTVGYSQNNFNFPACSYISNYAFYYSTIVSIKAPVCTRIAYYAFNSCQSLASANFPACTSIGSSAFGYCSALTTANFPSCTMVDGTAFVMCTSLTTASFPVCTSIGSSAFEGCRSLTTAYFPICQSIYNMAFRDCQSLASVNFPACTIIGSSAFQRCSALTSVDFSSCITVNGTAFASCTSLTTASFPACTRITGYAFQSCYHLLSLYLLGSSLCSLAAITAFTSTPISTYTTSTGGVYGSIYVPASLLASYQTSTNWVNYSSRFVGV